MINVHERSRVVATNSSLQQPYCIPGCTVDGCVWSADRKAGAEDAAVTAVGTRVITSNVSRNAISASRKTLRTITRWLAVTNSVLRDVGF